MAVAFFYNKEEYEKLLSIADDRKTMCATYNEWLFMFMKMKNNMAEQQVTITPIFIEAATLEKWCKQNKVKNNGSSRSRYVLSLVEK